MLDLGGAFNTDALLHLVSLNQTEKVTGKLELDYERLDHYFICDKLDLNI